MIVGAFTVKHELVTWLSDMEEEDALDLLVTRIPDGKWGASPLGDGGRSVSIEDLLRPKGEKKRR